MHASVGTSALARDVAVAVAVAVAMAVAVAILQTTHRERRHTKLSTAQLPWKESGSTAECGNAATISSS